MAESGSGCSVPADLLVTGSEQKFVEVYRCYP